MGEKTDFGKTDWKKLTYRSPRFRTPQGKWTDCPVTAVRFLPSCSKKGWYSLKTDSLLRKCSNWPEKKGRYVVIFLWGKRCKIGLEENYYYVKKYVHYRGILQSIIDFHIFFTYLTLMPMNYKYVVLSILSSLIMKKLAKKCNKKPDMNWQKMLLVLFRSSLF